MGREGRELVGEGVAIKRESPRFVKDFDLCALDLAVGKEISPVLLEILNDITGIAEHPSRHSADQPTTDSEPTPAVEAAAV